MPSLRQLHGQFVICLLVVSSIALAQQPGRRFTWSDALKQKPDWFTTPDALRIADNLLLYQRDSGGWPKNTDMAVVLSDADKTKLTVEKKLIDSTIDNSSTYTQLSFLARVFTAQHQV